MNAPYNKNRIFIAKDGKEPSISYYSLKPINTMGKFINPFTDFGFKHIFGREMNKDILIEFLNDLLKGEHTIMDLRIMNNEQ